VARDARSELGDMVARAGRAAGTALEWAGEAAGDALSGLFAGGGVLGSGAEPLASTVLPELTPVRPLNAGEEVRARLRLVNSGDAATEPFGLAATDLASDDGGQIPAAAVSVPGEQRVVAGHHSDSIALAVTVPADAKPGIYRGELRPTDESVPPLPLLIHVH
jgi:hypothetical protein